MKIIIISLLLSFLTLSGDPLIYSIPTRKKCTSANDPCPITGRFKGALTRCEGTMCKYQNYISYPMYLFNEDNLNVILIPDPILIRNKKCLPFGDWTDCKGKYYGKYVDSYVKNLYGKKIDTVSGSIYTYTGNMKFTFKDAPVIVFTDYDMKDPKECECPRKP